MLQTYETFESLSKEIEDAKKTQMEILKLGNTITIIKSKWKDNSRMEGTEERISELEKSPIQAIERKKRLKK